MSSESESKSRSGSGRRSKRRRCPFRGCRDVFQQPDDDYGEHNLAGHLFCTTCYRMIKPHYYLNGRFCPEEQYVLLESDEYDEAPTPKRLCRGTKYTDMNCPHCNEHHDIEEPDDEDTYEAIEEKSKRRCKACGGLLSGKKSRSRSRPSNGKRSKKTHVFLDGEKKNGKEKENVSEKVTRYCPRCCKEFEVIDKGYSYFDGQLYCPDCGWIADKGYYYPPGTM